MTILLRFAALAALSIALRPIAALGQSSAQCVWQPFDVPPLPKPGTTSRLSGVRAVSPTDAWAWGAATEGLGPGDFLFFPQVLHFDGKAWSNVPLPSGLPTNWVISDLSARSADDVWVAGSVVNYKTNPYALFLHWNGTAWSIFKSAAKDASIAAISAATLPKPDAWAVANVETQTEITAYIEHFDGRQWVLDRGMPLRNIGLSTIAADSLHNLWVGGTNAANGNLLMRLNPFSLVWSIEPVPSGIGLYSGTMSLKGGQLWIVSADADWRTTLYTVTDKGWTQVPMPGSYNRQGTNWTIDATSETTDDVWFTHLYLMDWPFYGISRYDYQTGLWHDWNDMNFRALPPGVIATIPLSKDVWLVDANGPKKAAYRYTCP